MSAAAAVPSTSRAAHLLDSHWRYALLALFAACFLIRTAYFGDPLIDPDEGFYLLVGDRMLDGALPYVDIWDRKPIGLFLIYALARLIGGEGVLGYQILAAACAAGTGVTIAVIARRIAPPGAALVSGLLYVGALAMSGGQGGQSPVFYNLPVALAALLTLNAIGGYTAAIRRRGLAAMLLVGLAMQIKYTAMFEGIFFGLMLCWSAWRADPRPLARLGDALLLAVTALLPTLAALLTYAAIGEAQAFVYANFVSIAERGSYGQELRDLSRTATRLLALAVPAAATALIPRGERPWRASEGGRTAHRFLLGWGAAALGGYLLLGSYFNHYALPLLAPLAILASPMFAVRRWRIGAILAVVALLVIFSRYVIDARNRAHDRGGAAYLAQLTDTVRPLLGGGTLYVFYGEPALYRTTGSPLPTRWAFPYHLSLRREGPALGVDPVTEVRRILDTRPAVIMDRAVNDDQLNPATRALVNTRLARDYRLAASIKRTYYTDRVWALKR